MTRPPRKPPVFGRCPVCGTEFWSLADQRWCSRDCARAAKRHADSTPLKRPSAEKIQPGSSSASAARHHNISRDTVMRRIRKGCPGWQFEAPYQIPAGFVPSDRARRGRRKREDRP
jgi:hypothetical protein